MSNRFISWAVFVLLCFIWGSSFILMKMGKTTLTAAEIAAIRIFSAGIIFVPTAIYHLRKISGKKLWIIIIAGFFGNLLPAFLFAEAVIKLDESAIVGILNSLTPIFVAILGTIFFKDKIERRKIVGIIIGFVGLCLLTLAKGDVSLDNLGYASLVLLATISYGLNVNIVSHYLSDKTPMQVSSVSLAFMAIPCAVILYNAGFLDLDFSSPSLQLSLFATVLLGIVGSSIATVLFYFLVQKAGGLFASLVTYGIPFVAVMWGVIDHEEVRPLEVVSLGIILFGVYLANRKKKESEVPQAPKGEE
ncbi:MAG: DMT family transporter [Chitinophagaceae bacterium]